VPSDEDEADSDDEGFGPRYYGSVISWSKADQLGPLGIQYVILALILVSGRVISDGRCIPFLLSNVLIRSLHPVDLRAHLKRLGLPLTGTLTFNARSTHKTMTVEQYLGMLMRQGYLDQQQTGEAAKKGKGKRGRVAANDDDSGATYEWRWGPRAQSEVGEKGIAQFVAEFMVGDAGDDEDEEEEEEAGRRGRARGGARKESAQDKLEKMLKGVERAAGGQLADLK
jgi:melanoma-associated antigen